jgi:hypothetical protein
MRAAGKAMPAAKAANALILIRALSCFIRDFSLSHRASGSIEGV